MKNNFFKILLSFFEITFVITGISLVCYLLLGQILEINGDSMLPLLQDKQRILAEKFSTKFSDLSRGEIVVFKSPAEPNRLLIKRVVGLPGDKVEISNGKVFINNQALAEPYIRNHSPTTGADALQENVVNTIPPRSYLLLGDNREKSIDSRYFGFVSKDLILGRAILVYKPASEFKFINLTNK